MTLLDLTRPTPMSTEFALLGQMYQAQLAAFRGVLSAGMAQQWRLLVCECMDKATEARCREREAEEMKAEVVASNWGLWRKLVDPAGAITRQPSVWYAMPLTRRIELARQALQE